MALSILAFVTAVVSLLLRLYDVADTWRTRRAAPVTPPAHPLEAVVRDIAAAIREGQETV